MRKTIITSSNHRQPLANILTSKEAVLTGVQILPFNAHFYEPKTNPDLDTLQEFDGLQRLKLRKLQTLISFPKTLHDFKDLAQKLNAYKLTLDDLPLDNEYDEDIRDILEYLNKSIKKVDDNIYYLSEGLAHHHLHYLETTGYQEFEIETTQHPHTIQYKNALNFRQEIEGAIQSILKENLDDVAIIIPNKASNLPFVQSVLERYGLFTANNSSFELVKRQYIAFLDYILNPNTQSIIDILENNVFKLYQTDAILFYISHFNLETTDILHNFNQFDAENKVNFAKDLIKLQNDIQDNVHLLQEKLNAFSCLPFEDKLLLALEYVTDFDAASSRKIHNYLQNIFSGITQDNLTFVKDQISRMGDDTEIHPRVKIYDINALPIKPIKHVIALGLSAKTLPGIKGQSGILDEAYLSRINNYPTQTERNNHQLKQKLSLFNKAENLVLSYHLINFEGKTQEPSFNVENFVKENGINKPTAWKIVENDPFMQENKKLSEDIAKKLYLKNGKLPASASSLEKYVKDPYKYFLEEGLKLSQPFDFGFDARVLGILTHKVLEKKMVDDSIQFSDIWNSYKNYFSKHNHFITHLINFSEKTVSFHIDRLRNLLKDSDFRIYEQEKYLQDESVFNGYAMRGFVDRIDVIEKEGNTSMMVIDYKSSDHSLSASSIKKGEQIQLLNYAILLHHKMKVDIFGVYYYSVNRKRTEELIYSYKQSRGIDVPTASTIDDYLENFVFNGWNFTNIDYFNVDVESFKSSKHHTTNDFKLSKGSVFDLEVTENFMKVLLQKIKRNILTGVIDKDTLDDDFIKHPVIRLEDINGWEEKK